MTSPPISAIRGSSVSRCPSIASSPNITAAMVCMASPVAVKRSNLHARAPPAPPRTLILGSACQATTPSPLLSHAYSASHFAGVILTYVTIITI